MKKQTAHQPAGAQATNQTPLSISNRPETVYHDPTTSGKVAII